MPARLATRDDIPELVRLRAVMLESVWGQTAGGWEASCAAILERGLAEGTMAAAVVDRPDGGGLAAAGVAVVGQRLPGPGCADGRYGYVQSMSTDPAHRRQGLGRAVFDCLMRWYAEAGVTRVDLHTSPMGEPLYRQFGFTDPAAPELRWRAAEP
jgi:GNAT superfamily N-acetyltransferase